MTIPDYEEIINQPFPDSVDECILRLEKIKTLMQSPTLSFAHLSLLNKRAQELGNHAKSLLYHTKHDHDISTSNTSSS
jgi:hypothetical protein